MIILTRRYKSFQASNEKRITSMVNGDNNGGGLNDDDVSFYGKYNQTRFCLSVKKKEKKKERQASAR